MQLYNYYMYLHCYTSNYIIHISVYNTETLECSQTLCECLMILEPVFKLTSHDALANIIMLMSNS